MEAYREVMLDQRSLVVSIIFETFKMLFYKLKTKTKKISKVRVGLRGLTTIYFSLKFQKNHNFQTIWD
jgi:hypothetical protein